MKSIKTKLPNLYSGLENDQLLEGMGWFNEKVSFLYDVTDQIIEVIRGY